MKVEDLIGIYEAKKEKHGKQTYRHINFIIFRLVLFLIWDHQVFCFKPKRAASLCFSAFP